MKIKLHFIYAKYIIILLFFSLVLHKMIKEEKVERKIYIHICVNKTILQKNIEVRLAILYLIVEGIEYEGILELL